MTSLENKVAHQRDALIARGPDIRLHAGRIQRRLRHPVVLIPAFMAGMLFERGAPALLCGLPNVTARLGHLTDELRKIQAFAGVVTALVPIVLSLFLVLPKHEEMRRRSDK